MQLDALIRQTKLEIEAYWAEYRKKKEEARATKPIILPISEVG